jgi:uncharacterized protein (DUF427 family)
VGLAWQQGPLAPRSVGHFLTPDPLPRLLFVEPLRRRMRVQLGDKWIADSHDVVLLHEPGRYPVAYFPHADVTSGVLVDDDHVTEHADLGPVTWFGVRAADREAKRAAWQYAALPDHANSLSGRVAFAWRAMDAFYEEDERILGHAADSRRPLVLYESGFAPRWYVPREDVDEGALRSVEGQTFCPYKGLASYYAVGDHARAAWSYPNAWTEVERVRNFVSFEPDRVDVYLDGGQLHLEPGQTVIAHGVDRGLDADEILTRI